MEVYMPIPDKQKDKILKAQKRDYSNQSRTTKENNLTPKDLEKKSGTNNLKDQPATKWRGDDSVPEKQSHRPSQD
jgi:hypothetical protein